MRAPQLRALPGCQHPLTEPTQGSSSHPTSFWFCLCFYLYRSYRDKRGHEWWKWRAGSVSAVSIIFFCILFLFFRYGNWLINRSSSSRDYWTIVVTVVLTLPLCPLLCPHQYPHTHSDILQSLLLLLFLIFYPYLWTSPYTLLLHMLVPLLLHLPLLLPLLLHIPLMPPYDIIWHDRICGGRVYDGLITRSHEELER